MLMPETLEVLSSPYTISVVNEPMLLFEGAAQVEFDKKRFPVTASVELTWNPSPQLVATFVCDDNIERHELFMEDAVLYLPNVKEGISFFCSGSNITTKKTVVRHQLRGNIYSYPLIGNFRGVAYVLAHLANFPQFLGKPICSNNGRDTKWWRGCLLFKCDGWIIRLDNVANDQNIYKELRGASGYAVTNLLKISKESGKTITLKQINDLKPSLFHFFSLLSGSKTEPFLDLGYSKSDQCVYEQWSVPNVDRWPSTPRLFNLYSPSDIVEFFPIFMEHMKDELWKGVLIKALSWYYICNRREPGTEGSIILAQSAFELLAWTHFVSMNRVSAGGFEKLPAADKLRLLLAEEQVPLAIPSSFVNLKARSKEFNWIDGPQAITEIRNRLVHPAPKHQSKQKILTVEEIHEAYYLSMWYLELSLLYASGYQGKYYNRCVRMKVAGQTERVPWKSNS